MNQQLSPGDVVAERFRVIALLGQGGMGEVYEAEQLNLARRVALKLLKPELYDKPGAQARFQREARAAAALRHTGAVQIHDFGEDEGRLYLSMELLRGATLRQLLGTAQQPLEPLDRALEIALQVTNVLVAAHEIGLVHRDLKPSNVFLVPRADGSERAVVADFGLAFIESRDDAGRMTREGVMAGTPAYISPEQALGRDLTPATDVYSLGCTLYEMVTGAVPFVDSSEMGVVTKHLFTAPAPAGDAQSDAPVPQALEDLLLAMLAKHPEERPAPESVLAMLTAVAERLGQRERSRADRDLLVREARMIPEPTALAQGPTLDGAPLPQPDVSLSHTAAVATFGNVDEELELPLAANGLALTPLAALDAPCAASALYAPGATEAELAVLAEHDLPLITDTAPADMQRIAALLELGVDEVLPRPVRPTELARRIQRAIKRFRGRRRPG